MIALLAILLALLQPEPIPLAATFTSSTSAAVTWHQPAGVPLTCLRIYHAGAEYPAGICYPNLPAGPQRIDLPGTLTHPAYRPAWGDRIVLAFGLEDVGQTMLGDVPSVYQVYLPLAMKTAAPVTTRPVYVALVRGG